METAPPIKGRHGIKKGGKGDSSTSIAALRRQLAALRESRKGAGNEEDEDAAISAAPSFMDAMADDDGDATINDATQTEAHQEDPPKSPASKKKRRVRRKNKNKAAAASSPTADGGDSAKQRALRSKIKKRILRRRRLRREAEAEGGGGDRVEVDLPADTLLEYSIAHCITSKKDARAMLQFTHKLLKCNLLSLAAPIAMTSDHHSTTATLKDTSADPEYEADPHVKLQRAYERYQRSRGGRESDQHEHQEGATSSSTTSTVLTPAPWDPYDVKPQVFALNTYIALPVFTSLPYLRHFCNTFGFSVRDPSGTLWADGGESRTTEDDAKKLMRSIIQLSAGSGGMNRSGSGGGAQGNNKSVDPPAEEVEVTADDLAALMDDEEPHISNKQSTTSEQQPPPPHEGAKEKPLSKAEKRKLIRKLRRKEAEKQAKENEERQQELWKSLDAHKTFQITQAAPINTYNVPLARPYFIGYFADVKTLLHNCKGVVPMRVDIVVNPASPLEMVLNRSATDQVLSGENLIQQAYQRVERSIQSELHVFFAVHCPEVVAARSVCYPQPSPEGSNPEDVIYDTIILVDTLGNPAASASKELAPMYREMQAHTDRAASKLNNSNNNSDDDHTPPAPPPPNPSFERVMQRVASGKHSGILLGHYSLSIIPFEAGDVFLQDGSSLFYMKQTYTDRRQQEVKQQQRGVAPMPPAAGGGGGPDGGGAGKWSAGVRGVGNASTSPGGASRPGEGSSDSTSSTPDETASQAPYKKHQNTGVLVRKGRSVVSSRATASQAGRDTVYINDPTMAHTEPHSITSQMFRTGQGAIP